jgi:hypothetical protein
MITASVRKTFQLTALDTAQRLQPAHPVASNDRRVVRPTARPA